MNFVMQVWMCICLFDLCIILITGCIFVDELKRGRFEFTYLIECLAVSCIHFRFDWRECCIYIRNPQFISE